LVSAMYNYRS